jgi:hypothetical protein
MKKSILLPWIALIILTISSAIISNYFFKATILVELILWLAALKFIAVAYYFMELKKAHVFWKVSTITFLLIFFISIISIL